GRAGGGTAVESPALDRAGCGVVGAGALAAVLPRGTGRGGVPVRPVLRLHAVPVARVAVDRADEAGLTRGVLVAEAGGRQRLDAGAGVAAGAPGHLGAAEVLDDHAHLLGGPGCGLPRNR